VQTLTAAINVLDQGSEPPLPSGIRVLNLPTNDLVFDPKSARIYASVPSIGSTYGNCVVGIDPLSGNIDRKGQMGSEPDRLAVSDDGQFLYAGLDGSDAVQRLDLGTLQTETPFFLGTDSSLQPYGVGQLAALPGEPHSVAVSRVTGNYSPSFAGIAVFDDDIERPKVESSFTDGWVIAAGATASRLYGFNNGTTEPQFVRMALDSSGVTVLDSTANLIADSWLDSKYDAGLVYTSSGQVVDPERLVDLGVFPGIGDNNLVLPSWADGQVYFLSAGILAPCTLQTYDRKTFVQIGSLAIPGVHGMPSSLVRWGAGRLAFRTTAGQVFLIGTTPVPPLPALEALAVGSTALAAGQQEQGTVVLSGAAPAGGLNVYLSSSNPRVASVASGVRVPAGSASARFPVTAGRVRGNTVVTITGTLASANKTVALVVTP
jgi:hypothetical protein